MEVLGWMVAGSVVVCRPDQCADACVAWPALHHARNSRIAPNPSPPFHLPVQISATFPFHVVCTLAFAGVWYGMGGLQPAAAPFWRFASVLTMYHLIACQVCGLYNHSCVASDRGTLTNQYQ